MFWGYFAVHGVHGCWPMQGRVSRRKRSPLFFSFFFSLVADGRHDYHPACGHQESSHFSPVHALRFIIAMQVQQSYNSSTNGWILLTHFPTLSIEHKSYFGKNRTHDFRTSRCAGYLLDHSGDEYLGIGYPLSLDFRNMSSLVIIRTRCRNTV